MIIILRPQNHWCRFDTDAASWHSCSIWKRVFLLFFFQQKSNPSHLAKDTVAPLDQEMPDFFLSHPLSGRLKPCPHTAENGDCRRIWRQSPFVFGDCRQNAERRDWRPVPVSLKQHFPPFQYVQCCTVVTSPILHCFSVCRLVMLHLQMYLWLDTEKGMEFRRQVPVRLSQPPWNNNEALDKNISVFQRRHQSINQSIAVP